jgi:ABC-type branched-subunit amino acid transport system substrate-binding protein
MKPHAAVPRMGLFYCGEEMSDDTVKVGLLFSRTGSYAALGDAMHAGALLAIDEVNADPAFHFNLAPVSIDPGGRLSDYFGAARRLLTSEGITHVIGCYTSSSRKEVLPLFEKYDGLLWYPSHYEGFETSDNVIYTGAAPNQHIVPLARYLLDTGRRTAWLVGSNYIWAWENNRIMRERLLAAGGDVVGERYFPVGDTDLGALIGQILDARPDFVFNTLIGESAYAFHQLLWHEARHRGLDPVADCPVASCSLAEPELARIGPDAAAGHLSSSVYFSTIDTAENNRFVRAWQRRFPALGQTSADAEASYIAVHLLARAFARADDPGFEAVRAAAPWVEFTAPQGLVRIDPENRHCHLRPRIGRSTGAGTFDIVWEYPAAIRPDPYLVWEPTAQARTAPSGPASNRPDGNRPASIRVVS